MKTVNQVKAEVYNAILANSTITGIMGVRLYWLSTITSSYAFPLMVYKFFDTVGSYSFDPVGVKHEADKNTFQIDIYTDPTEMGQMDTLYEALKTTMNAIGYRNINAPIEFIEATINKVIRPTRWEKHNA